MIYLIGRCCGDPSPALSLLPGDGYGDMARLRMAPRPLPPVPSSRSCTVCLTIPIPANPSLSKIRWSRWP